jgi:hypothetical protein
MTLFRHSPVEQDNPSRYPDGLPGIRNVRWGWRWARRLAGRSRQSHRLGRALRVTPIAAFMVAGVLIVGVVISPKLGGALDPERSIALSFTPDVLLSADDHLYVGSSNGELATFDPVRDIKENAYPLPFPINSLVAYGDHVFAAGAESISRLTPDLSEHFTRTIDYANRHLELHHLASGPLGIWALAGPGAQLLHISSMSLKTVQHFDLNPAATDIAVSERGVWALVPDKKTVELVAPHLGSWRVQTIALRCQPSSIIPSHDRVFILCGNANQVIVLTDLHTRMLRTYRVGGQAQKLALGNGSLWLLAPGDDHVEQLALRTGKGIGNPVSVGSESAGFAVDRHAVWVGDTADDSLIRVDLGTLVSIRRSVHRSTTIFGVPRWAWVLSLGLLIGIVAGVTGALIRLSNVNRKYPPYFPAKRIWTYMINNDLYEAIASPEVTSQTRRRDHSSRLMTHGGIAGIATHHSRSTTEGGFPLDRNVRETLRDLSRADLVYYGLGYVPGFRHRGTRMYRAAEPTSAELLDQFDDIAALNTICLIANGTWKIIDHGAKLTFTLDEIFDRTAGHLHRLKRPDDATLSFAIRKTDLRGAGIERCVPGTTIKMDVLAQAVPRGKKVKPHLDLIVAWCGAPGANEWSEAKGYALPASKSSSFDAHQSQSPESSVVSPRLLHRRYRLFRRR